jgi:hypothetical protein
MDEVTYNERGNSLTMIKRPESSLDSELIESLAPDDEEDKAPATNNGEHA